MDYERSTAALRDPARAVEAVRTMLLGAGFRVTTSGDAIVGDAPRLNSTREPPLRGAGNVEILREATTLRVRSDLRGARFLARFVLIFPFALGALLAITPGMTFRFAQGSARPAWIALAAVAPWLVVSPLMALWIRSRTIAALDVLVANAEDAGG